MINRPSIFLDRDGVIIENRKDYVKSWEEVCFLSGVFESLQRLGQSHYRIVLVTNQSAVGRGILPLDRAMDINQRIIGEIEAQGGRIDANYLCPHRPDEGCACRKPAPGMLLKGKMDLGLNLEDSFLVGDAASDIEAAWAVGAKGILVLTGRGQDQLRLLKGKGEFPAFHVVQDLRGAADYILLRGGTGP